MSEKLTGEIVIIKVPDGEAPLWVRQAWLGITLPCHPFSGPPDSGFDSGVLTGERVSGMGRVSVPQEQAIQILAKTNPEAAGWWRLEGFPYPNLCFGFRLDDVEIISNVSPKIIRHISEEDRGYRDR